MPSTGDDHIPGAGCEFANRSRQSNLTENSGSGEVNGFLQASGSCRIPMIEAVEGDYTRGTRYGCTGSSSSIACFNCAYSESEYAAELLHRRWPSGPNITT